MKIDIVEIVIAANTDAKTMPGVEDGSVEFSDLLTTPPNAQIQPQPLKLKDRFGLGLDLGAGTNLIAGNARFAQPPSLPLAAARFSHPVADGTPAHHPFPTFLSLDQPSQRHPPVNRGQIAVHDLPTPINPPRREDATAMMMPAPAPAPRPASESQHRHRENLQISTAKNPAQSSAPIASTGPSEPAIQRPPLAETPSKKHATMRMHPGQFTPPPQVAKPPLAGSPDGVAKRQIILNPVQRIEPVSHQEPPQLPANSASENLAQESTTLKRAVASVHSISAEKTLPAEKSIPAEDALPAEKFRSVVRFPLPSEANRTVTLKPQTAELLLDRQPEPRSPLGLPHTGPSVLVPKDTRLVPDHLPRFSTSDREPADLAHPDRQMRRVLQIPANPPANSPPTVALPSVAAVTGDTLGGPNAQAETLPPLSLGEATLPTTAPHTGPTLLAAHQADHGPRVAQIVADAARQLQDRPIELTLYPQELGRVRLKLHAADGAMSVVVTVERPETMDLLRKNIDLLANQLREFGYKDLSFEFAEHSDFSDGDSQDSPADHDEGSGQDNTQQEFLPSAAASIALVDGVGIDIRL